MPGHVHIGIIERSGFPPLRHLLMDQVHAALLIGKPDQVRQGSLVGIPVAATAVSLAIFS